MSAVDKLGAGKNLASEIQGWDFEKMVLCDLLWDYAVLESSLGLLLELTLQH